MLSKFSNFSGPLSNFILQNNLATLMVNLDSSYFNPYNTIFSFNTSATVSYGVTYSSNSVSSTVYSGNWDTKQAVSNEAYNGKVKLKFKSGLPLGNLMCGFSDNPFSISTVNYNKLNYGFYLQGSNFLSIVEGNNFNINPTIGTYSSSTIYSIIYDEISVNYYVDDLLIYTSNTIPTNPLYLYTTFLNGGLSVVDMEFGSTNSTWYDLSGNNNNFNLINSPIYENNLIYFNPTYSQYAIGDDLGNLNKFTIDAWFVLKSLPTYGKNPQIVTNIYDENYINFSIGFLSGNPIGNNWDGKINAGFFTGVPDFWKFTDGFSPEINKLYNTVLTYDEKHLKLYLNGVIYSSVTCSNIALSSNLGINIGKRWDLDEFIDGYIPIVKIWNGDLYPTQILANYNNVKNRNIFNTSKISRYFKLVINKIKDINEPGASGCTQMSNLILRLNDVDINWNNSAIASNPSGTYSLSETPQNLLDNNVNTKWCDQNYLDNGEISYVYIDNLIPITFDSYYYTTANDSSGRDPVSWTLEISDDNSNWTLIDTQTNVSITDVRKTATQVFTIN